MGIQQLTMHLCKKHGLNGIFEIEFLHANGETYFLELNLLPGLYGIDQRGLMPVMETVLVPYLQHFHVEIQPRFDFKFNSMGQFYPPSGTSFPYYVSTYGDAIDVASSRPPLTCSDEISEDGSGPTTVDSLLAADLASSCPSEETSTEPEEE